MLIQTQSRTETERSQTEVWHHSWCEVYIACFISCSTQKHDWVIFFHALPADRRSRVPDVHNQIIQKLVLHNMSRPWCKNPYKSMTSCWCVSGSAGLQQLLSTPSGSDQSQQDSQGLRFGTSSLLAEGLSANQSRALLSADSGLRHTSQMKTRMVSTATDEHCVSDVKHNYWQHAN